MNQFESALVAQNSVNPKLVNPEYELTLPPFISKNIQLYEFLIASLQYHPCYLSYIVEKNPNLAATETSGLIESIFGDLEENQRLIRLLMGLHRMIIKSSVARSDFKQALQVKAGDLSAHIYNYILGSQPQNFAFLATIAVEIISVINKYAFRNNPLGVATQNTQYIRDLEVKEEHKEQSEKREKNFDLCMDEILKLIQGAMQNDPKYRQKFNSESKLSNEVKYMFKEVPQVMKHNFPKDSATREGRSTIHSKVVALFLLPIIEMLKMPETLKSKAHDQIEALKDKDNEIDNWDQFIEQNKSNIWNVAQGLERFSERESNKYDKYLESIHNSLIDVPEITLRDWFLVDMLSHSIEPTAYRHTMTIKSLLMMYKLIFKHIHILEDRFPPHDPVILITKSLGDTNLFIPQLIDIQHSDYKVNLTLPTRWLLREKNLQVCPHCQMTLTTSLLPDRPPDEGAALSIPLTWRCTNCGNIQTDDNNRCMSCNELRIAFPNNYIFKPFLPLYQDAFLDSFIELLMRIPPIPKNVTIREFLQDMEKNSDETEMELKSMIMRFTKSLNKRATKYLQREGDEIIGVYSSPEQRQEMACEEIIRLFEEEAKEEFLNRTAYRSYLDYMSKSLKNIEMRIQLDIAKFTDSYITDIQKSIKKISPETPKEGKSQGRFTADWLMNDANVLIKMDQPKPIRKASEFYFIEGNDGSFLCKVIFTERSNKYLCLGGRPNESQIGQFEIPALKLREMRRTLNSRAITTFGENYTFNVFQLVRLLQRLLGQDLK